MCILSDFVELPISYSTLLLKILFTRKFSYCIYEFAGIFSQLIKIICSFYTSDSANDLLIYNFENTENKKSNKKYL